MTAAKTKIKTPRKRYRRKIATTMIRDISFPMGLALADKLIGYDGSEHTSLDDGRTLNALIKRQLVSGDWHRAKRARDRRKCLSFTPLGRIYAQASLMEIGGIDIADNREAKSNQAKNLGMKVSA